MDLNMPVMDGIDCVKNARLKERQGECDLSKTKIIGLSAIGETLFR